MIVEIQLHKKTSESSVGDARNFISSKQMQKSTFLMLKRNKILKTCHTRFLSSNRASYEEEF